MKTKVILLDIGGVLIEFAGINRMIEWMGGGVTHDAFLRRWIESAFVKLYESGKCSIETFAGGVVKELGMDVSPGDYIKEFPTFVKGFFPGAIELLEAIKPNYRLACLSNTNALQWDALRAGVSIDKYFHHTFLSFETGKLKPGQEAYAHAVKILGCHPGEIAFFDDNEVNVQAGIHAGMMAYRVLGSYDLKEKLEMLNLL